MIFGEGFKIPIIRIPTIICFLDSPEQGSTKQASLSAAGPRHGFPRVEGGKHWRVLALHPPLPQLWLHSPHQLQFDQDPSTGSGKPQLGPRQAGLWLQSGLLQEVEGSSLAALASHLPAFHEQSPLHRTGPYRSGAPLTHSLQLVTYETGSLKLNVKIWSPNSTSTRSAPHEKC